MITELCRIISEREGSEDYIEPGKEGTRDAA